MAVGDSEKISELNTEAPQSGFLFPCVKVDPSGNPIETIYVTMDQLNRMQSPAKIEVTSAQVKAIFTTPKTLIAAPGVKKVIRPIGITAYNPVGAAPYTTDAPLNIGYDTGQILFQLSQAWLGSGTSKIYVPYQLNAGTDGENKPLILWKAASPNPTVGTGSIFIKVNYVIDDYN